MRFLTLEHVPQEGPGKIADFIQKRGDILNQCRMYESSMTLPQSDSFDALIIMGGPMGVYEQKQYPWLQGESDYIRQAIDDRKHVLGVCLGAQLIAQALDAEVRKNPVQEIGWYPIQFSDAFLDAPIGQGLTQTPSVLHWHGDTFALPEGAIQMASSEGCQSQGFVFEGRVLALQFHLEMGVEEVDVMIQAFEHQLVAERFVQSAEKLRAATPQYEPAAQDCLMRLLSNWLS